jgi:hydrogenase maturation protease
MTTPLLIFGWGNPSRGDDALGPLFIEKLRAEANLLEPGCVEFLDDFQLQVEHAVDLEGRERVLFVDASVNCSSPYAVTGLIAARDASFSTHAMSPQSVMQVFRDLYRREPPACTLLAIRGSHFELGQPPGPRAMKNLACALRFGRQWLANGRIAKIRDPAQNLLDAADRGNR